MAVSLTFQTVAECSPERDQEILLIRANEFYWTYSIRLVRVFYRWEEVDEKGSPTGGSIFYSENEPQPENTRLLILVEDEDGGAESLEPDSLWVSSRAVQDSVFLKQV